MKNQSLTSKKCLSNIFDVVFWGLIMLLPLIAWVIGLSHDSSYTLSAAVENIATFGTTSDYITFDTLSKFFEGAESFLPFISTQGSPFITYITYLILVEFVHVIVDIIVFLPRLCHKFMDSM